MAKWATIFSVLLHDGGRAAAFVVSPVKEIGADERIEVAVHDFVNVAALHFRAVIFNELIGLHGVRANLAAKTNFGLGGIELVQGFAAFLKFQLVELRAQNFHGPLAIFVLTSFVLALHDNSRRKMRDANRRLYFVHVLATVATCAKSIDAKIVRFHHDVDFIVDLGNHKNGSERSVAAGGLVKRRYAHQAMHTALSGEHAVRVLTGYLYSGGFDSGFFTGS